MRRVLSTLASLACLVPAIWFVAANRGARQPKRAVVVVVIDTLRADAVREPELGGAPNPWAQGGNHGCVSFERAYSSSGWTLPSVASLLTGVDPEVHHAHGKQTVLAPISPDVTTLAESFRDQGFRTVAVTNAAFLSPLLGLDRGFDVYDHEHAYNRSGRRAEETVDRALRYADQYANDDLFLFVHIFDPHLDYDPLGSGVDDGAAVTLSELRALQEQGGPTAGELRRVREMYDREASAALIAAHRLYDHWLQSGRFDELTFVLTADHGEEFYEHEGFEHGHSLHAELVHVPLLMSIDITRFCGYGEQGVVSTRDLGRVLLGTSGLDVPASFAPSTSDWRGKGGGTAYSSTTLYGPDRIALRTDAHAVLLELHEGESALGVMYDLTADPGESVPLEVDRGLRDVLMERRRANRAAGRATRRVDWLEMGPGSFGGSAKRAEEAEREETVRSLESLGYVGSGRENEDENEFEIEEEEQKEDRRLRREAESRGEPR